jgi:hypothetical protein
MDINYSLHGQLILITWHKPDKKKNQLLPDNKTEQKRNVTGLTDTEQSTEIMTRDDNSYGPESAWDIHKLTCMDNTPTNGNFNDEHGYPWKLTITQDYNKHMQYNDLGDRMKLIWYHAGHRTGQTSKMPIEKININDRTQK